jgi:aryl-alcohol dehydrogenase-like predicted oxidoreductase
VNANLNKSQLASKLVLGTVQLGLNYGIANATGQPSKKTAFQLLDLSYSKGIKTFDTAIAYGISEQIIGEWVEKTNNTVNIITKISTINSKDSLENDIRTQVEESRNRLNIDKINGLMLHSHELLGKYKTDIVKVLSKLKSEGIVEKIGVSVYSLSELLDAINYPELEIFQAPLNIFQNDILSSTKLKEFFAKNANKLFVRSTFLQGLFFLSEEVAESKVVNSGQFIKKLRSQTKSHGISIQELALSFSLFQDIVSGVVIGVEEPSQLSGNLDILNSIEDKEISIKMIDDIKRAIGKVPENVYNPSLWRTK